MTAPKFDSQSPGFGESFFQSYLRERVVARVAQTRMKEGPHQMKKGAPMSEDVRNMRARYLPAVQ